MEGIKYVNLIEIGPVVIEIRGAENGELSVPVNNTLVSHTAFLAADTRLCVLILVLFVFGHFLISNEKHCQSFSEHTMNSQAYSAKHHCCDTS